MRLIDADKLPVSKVGNIQIVVLEDIKKARVYPERPLAPKKMIDVQWLQKRMIDGISTDERHLESSAFELINQYIDEYREAQNAND